jgi:CRP-like cAMP-binding protein
VVHIPHDDLRQLAGIYPGIRRAFWKEMAIEAAIRSRWIGNTILKSSLSRTAHLLCELALRMEHAGLSTVQAFALKTTQGQLAGAVGLTGVHMNRVLRDLRERGLISTDARTITIRNWSGLCDVAEFYPSYLD